ncbi:hypothetical protein [Candidatus Symbiopectobacterium sp.]|uniref:hypothetical protein n=1 Tax=Candidatus Symbiopectobacterium sp. TaxID=2816440 RepID=UPI0025C26F8C|nr:hypothetical protein [Candidatus Symbiopectobacterium sp.]
MTDDGNADGHFCHYRVFHRRCLFTKRASYINFSHCIPHPKPDISHCNQHIEYTNYYRSMDYRSCPFRPAAPAI